MSQLSEHRQKLANLKTVYRVCIVYRAMHIEYVCVEYVYGAANQNQINYETVIIKLYTYFIL